MNDQFPVSLSMLLLLEEGAVIRVALDGENGTSVVLPLSQITVEPGAGRSLRVTMPSWLAKDRNLITAADGRQGSLL